MVKEKICKILRKSIIHGTLSPGERLVESDLSEKHSVSRGMIREALTLLSNEGFTTITPNKGATVAKISTQDLKDFYQLLAILERKATEWATSNTIGGQIDKLIGINDSIKAAMISDSETKLQDWGKLNLSFHRFFWDRCKNDKLGWLVEMIRQRTFRYRTTLFMITSYDEYLEDHTQIIDSVMKKNPVKAGQIMEEHVHRALNVLLNFFSHT